MRIGFPENIRCIRRQRRQSSSAQRFHHDHGDPRFGQDLILLFGTVKFPVKIVQLDLCKIPASRIDDLLQYFRRIVERKTEPPDFSFFFHPFQKFTSLIFLCQPPVCGIQSMEHVKIKIIRFAAFQLFPEDPFYSRRISGKPYRHFIGQIIRVAGIGFQQPAETAFTASVVVHIGGIEVIASGFHCPVDHLFDCCGINFGLIR